MAPAFVFVPPAGFEANVELRPLPRSFVTIFNNAGSPATTAAHGFAPAEMADRLSPRVFGDALPAWHRVPKTAEQLPGRRRATIMKRVSSPYAWWSRCQRARVLDRDTTVKAEGKQRPTQRRRLHGGLGEKSDVPEASFAPVEEEEETSEVYTDAIVHVVDHLSRNPGELFKLDPDNYRFGGLSPIVREKRLYYFEVPTPVESNDAYYNDLMNLIVDLWLHNGLETEETDLVKRLYALQTKSDGVRKPLAAAGITDLSTVMDMTEPDTTYTFDPPTNRATSLSAADRKARLTTAMPTFGRSISPLKRAGQSSNDSNTVGDLTHNQSSSFHTAPPASPIRTGTYGFSYGNGTSSEDSSSLVENPKTPSQRPEPPTPSRGNHATPTTPHQFEDAATRRALRYSGTHCDLSGSLRKPENGQSTLHPLPTTPNSWKGKTNSMDLSSMFPFADTSRAPSEAFSPIKPSNRRQSEPLRQSLLKDLAGRASLSPQKFLAGDDVFDHTISTTHASPARTQRSSIGTTSFIGDITKPLGTFFQRGPPLSPVRQTTPTSPARYEVNCAESLDIFGKKTPVAKRTIQPAAASPSQSPTTSPVPSHAATPTFNRTHQSPVITPALNTAVKDLAKLATNYCGSEAKVFVAKEDGKLKVRFKLPEKYAHLFPSSQLTQASQFSANSDIEMNDSPMIRFAPSNTARPISPERMSPARRELARTHTRKPLDGSPARLLAASMRARLETEREGTDAEVADADAAELDNTIAQEDGNDAPRDMTFTFDISANARRQQFGLDSFATAAEHTPTQSFAQTPTQLAAYTSSEQLDQTPISQADTLGFVHDRTLIMPDFDATNAAHSTPQAEQINADTSLLDNTSMITPTAQLQREALNAPGSDIPSELDFTPSFATPTAGNIGFTPSMLNASAGHGRFDTPSIVDNSAGHSKLSSYAQRDTPSRLPSELSFDPSFATPTIANMDASTTMVRDFAGHSEKHFTTPNEEQRDDAKKTLTGASNTTPRVTEDRTSPPVKTSFTPVNKPTSQREEVTATTSKAPTPTSANSKPPSATKAPTPTSAKQLRETRAVSEPMQATTTKAKAVDHDEDNRAYLAAFLKKAPKQPKQARSSTTESGSPVPPTTTRQPLGAKSPNASPSPRKRKSEADPKEVESPKKKKVKKAAADSAPKASKRPAREAKKTGPKVTKRATPEADPYEVVDEDEPMTVGAEQTKEGCRRSTRIMAQPVESAAPKTSIPISKYSRAGAGRGNVGTGLTPVVRNEQVELTRQTSNNTRKNRFKAESVQDTLARVLEESKNDSDPGDFKSKPSSKGKTLGWASNLEEYQQTPQKGKKAGRPKATLGETGVTKSRATPAKAIPRPSAAATRGPSQVATKLGMGANGTPAKRRVTRSRTAARSQK